MARLRIVALAVVSLLVVNGCDGDSGTETDAGQRPGLCVAFSPDGVDWTKHPQAPLLPIQYGPHAQDVPLSTDTDRPWSVPLSMSDGTDVIRFLDPSGMTEKRRLEVRDRGRAEHQPEREQRKGRSKGE